MNKYGKIFVKVCKDLSEEKLQRVKLRELLKSISHPSIKMKRIQRNK